MSTVKRPAARTASRREQLRRDQEQAAREKKVRRWVTLGVIGLSLVVAIALVAVAVSHRGADDVAGGTRAQSGAVEGTALVAGRSDAPVTVDVYQDYLCPFCGQFERANRDDLESLVADGTVRVRFHVMNFLDPQSGGTRYSTRAANAAVTVARDEPDKLVAFNAALFDHQPGEGSRGLGNDEIARLARAAGVSDATTQKFAAGDDDALVQASNQAAAAAGVQSTPTVKINNQTFDRDRGAAGGFKAAVELAAAG